MRLWSVTNWIINNRNVLSDISASFCSPLIRYAVCATFCVCATFSISRSLNWMYQYWLILLSVCFYVNQFSLAATVSPRWCTSGLFYNLAYSYINVFTIVWCDHPADVALYASVSLWIRFAGFACAHNTRAQSIQAYGTESEFRMWTKRSTRVEWYLPFYFGPLAGQSRDDITFVRYYFECRLIADSFFFFLSFFLSCTLCTSKNVPFLIVRLGWVDRVL